jgi:putative transposase
VGKVAKRHGVSEPSIYAWRKKFGDMGTDDVKRLRQLEQENNRLKKIVAERDLEIEVIKEIAGKKWLACRRAWSKPGMPLAGV